VVGVCVGDGVGGHLTALQRAEEPGCRARGPGVDERAAEQIGVETGARLERDPEDVVGEPFQDLTIFRTPSSMGGLR
jgi:hypothetical protein